MNVKLLEINGLWAAIDSMYFSKRSWTSEKEDELKELYSKCYDHFGFFKPDCNKEDQEKFFKLLRPLLKWGVMHTTLLSFIDFTFSVEGLHRAGQDDWDSHAKRFDNRIVRSSTRLATFTNEEKSTYYKDKILTTEEVLDMFNYQLPNSIDVNGSTYVKTSGGYVLDGMQNDRDVTRGLNRLCIPSNFIFKVNAKELAHVIQQRDTNSHANPEVKTMTEEIKRLIERKYPFFNENFWYSVHQ